MSICLDTFVTPSLASVALSLQIRFFSAHKELLCKSCGDDGGSIIFAFQGDDFKTPEGDVEDNPEDFANK